MKIINKIKALWKLPEQLKQEVEYLSRRLTCLQSQIEYAEKFIRDRTDVSVDVGYRGPDTVIVTGKYRGVDYVQVYDVTGTEFHHIVQELQEMRKHHKLKAIDHPRQIRYVVPQLFEGMEKY